MGIRSVFANYIEPGMLVFDVGANKGLKSQQYLESGCRVVSIEPNPLMYNKLKERFRDSHPIENFAMGAKEGLLPLHICRDSNGEAIPEICSMSKEFRDGVSQNRFSCYKYDEKDYITVPVTTLDTMIERHGIPDYVKIDVEGFELEVLKGLTYPIGLVSIEFTPEICEATVDCIKRFLKINPEYMFNYSSRETDLMTFDADVDSADMIKFLRGITDTMVEYGDVYAVGKK